MQEGGCTAPAPSKRLAQVAVLTFEAVVCGIALIVAKTVKYAAEDVQPIGQVQPGDKVGVAGVAAISAYDERKRLHQSDQLESRL